MPTLVLLAHVGPDAVPLFQSALDAAGIEHVELRAFVENGLSSAYHALAARLRTGGRILPALLRHAGASLPLSGYDAVIYCGWSAAYGLMENLVEVTADRDALAGLICCDSGYGTAPAAVVDFARLARDGRKLYSALYTDVPTSGYPSSGAFLAQVQREAGPPEGLFTVEHRAFDPAARAAKLHGLIGEARGEADAAFWRGEHVAALHAGPRLLVAGLQALGLVEVPDASPAAPRDAIPPPPLTARTGTLPPPPARAMLPTLEEEPRDLRRGDHGADVGELQARLNALGAQLTVDGSFGPKTEEAVKAFQRSSWIGADGVLDHATRKELAATYAASKVAPTEPPSDTRATEVDAATMPLRARALAIALGELGVHETPGPATTVRVQEYIDGCVRGGKLLGLTGDEPAWCCAFSGWAEHAAALHGERVAPWRAAVSEAWKDAVLAGSARARTWIPQPGDLAVFGRVVNGQLQDPRNGGAGHVAFVELVPDAAGLFGIIGGNQGGAEHFGGAVTRETRSTTARELVGWIEVG